MPAAPAERARSERVSVRLVQGATPLVTYRAGDTPADVTGAIVRVVMDVDATQLDRDAVKASLLQAGALHVTLASASARARVVTKRAARATTKVETFNDALAAMLEAARTNDRARLKDLVEHYLEKASA